MGWKRWALGGALAWALAAPAAAEGVCALPAPTVIAQSGDPHSKGGSLLQLWEVAEEPVWWSTAQPGGYGDVRAEISRHVAETDPLRLLSQDPWTNNRIVAEHAADWIGPINCLEMLLQLVQHERIGMFEAPTEFMAIVLRSPDRLRLRVYYYTVNEDWIGRVSPVADPALADARTGWSVLAVLHNHAFHPDQPLLNGPVAPSKPDAQLMASFAADPGVAEAWITNGLHTARIPASAFDLFERDGQ